MNYRAAELSRYELGVNYLAAELRGMLWLLQTVKQRRLALVMSVVVFALVLDIVPYGVGCCVLTDGVCIVAFRPEFTTPQHPFDLTVTFEELLCSNAFNGLN